MNSLNLYWCITERILITHQCMNVEQAAKLVWVTYNDNDPAFIMKYFIRALCTKQVGMNNSLR